MQLDHEFTVPVPAAQAWPVLLDIDRIAPCMPGATVTKVDGDDFEGTVKVKVGPITVTYGGSASFLEKDESDRRAVIEARGRETRGSGTATARVTAQLFDQGESTRVVVNTDLSVTGKPAQFGRGVMSDVGGKLLGRFADCLAGQLAGEQHPAPRRPGGGGARVGGGRRPGRRAGRAAGVRRRRGRTRRHPDRRDPGAPPGGRGDRPDGGGRWRGGQAARPAARRARADRGRLHRLPPPPLTGGRVADVTEVTRA